VVCGQCYYCKRGYHNFCENLLPGQAQGGFSEYGIAKARGLLKIPDSVLFTHACLTEPLACCINGNLLSSITLGDCVAIIGTGPIGLMHVQLSRHQGACIIASDLQAERLNKAQELGASYIINAAQENPVERVQELTNGYGADAVIVAVGGRPAFQQALEMVGKNGTINFFAGTHPPAILEVDPNLIHYKQIRLTGSSDYTPVHFETALQLITTKTIMIEPLISHILPLAQIREGFELVSRRRGLKVVIQMNH
jgi:L-iditol 2-dehydrogenase